MSSLTKRIAKTMSDETSAVPKPNPFHPIFKGTGEERFKPEELLPLPPAPTWRRADRRKAERGATFQATSEEIELVNAAGCNPKKMVTLHVV
jgi:hypothetical protein